MLFAALAKDDHVNLGPAKAAPTQQRLALTVLWDMSCTAQSHCTRQMLMPHWPSRVAPWQLLVASGTLQLRHRQSWPCWESLSWLLYVGVMHSQFSRGGAAAGTVLNVWRQWSHVLVSQVHRKERTEREALTEAWSISKSGKQKKTGKEAGTHSARICSKVCLYVLVDNITIIIYYVNNITIIIDIYYDNITIINRLITCL